MPIYEYNCPVCHLKFDMLRRMSQSDEKADCPKCGHQSGRAVSLFSCFAKDDAGFTAPVGGNSCSGCQSSSCDSCGAG
ncbi:MAG: zinc ribbon domain-containing protein [Dehalococcoidia bacterium]|nr:zinc ribbon domain-containing protein [Dehalococcoidia bacterium]